MVIWKYTEISSHTHTSAYFRILSGFPRRNDKMNPKPKGWGPKPVTSGGGTCTGNGPGTSGPTYTVSGTGGTWITGTGGTWITSSASGSSASGTWVVPSAPSMPVGNWSGVFKGRIGIG